MAFNHLRIRFALLGLLAVLPAAVALEGTVRVERALLDEVARGRALAAARQVGDLHARAIGDTAGVVLGLARLPAILAHDAPGCEAVVRSIRASAADLYVNVAAARQEAHVPRVLDPNALVLGAERLLRRVLGEDVRLVLALDPAVRSVRADAGQLEQALLNLAINARDAMARDGRLELRTRALPDGRVSIEVTDDGVGMSPEVQRRIFEPFFTTKATGTGLGLSIVKDVVSRANATIRVVSAPDAGTTFAIELPGTPEAPEAVVEPEAVVVAGTETVLLVEDDDAVRTFARRALEEEGYRVIEAVDGVEAEACASAYVGPIHLLLTDLVMPGRGGEALVERIGPSRPEMVALFMTGYATPPASDGRGRLEVLRKPFGAQVLLRRVREALDGASTRPPDGLLRPDGLKRA